MPVQACGLSQIGSVCAPRHASAAGSIHYENSRASSCACSLARWAARTRCRTWSRSATGVTRATIPIWPADWRAESFERWAFRLARWLDRSGAVVEASGNFGPALRLFGVQRFRSGQLSIVLAALSGKSVLVVSPTGSGKTLCFQLPAVLRQGVSLVVCPLKTLMSEQVSDLLTKKIPATFINSDLSAEEKETRFSLLRDKPSSSSMSLLRGFLSAAKTERLISSKAGHRSSSWTKRTASINGDMTSAPSMAGCERCGRSLAHLRCSPSRPRPARRCRNASWPLSAYRTPGFSSVMSTGRTSRC